MPKQHTWLIVGLAALFNTTALWVSAEETVNSSQAVVSHEPLHERSWSLGLALGAGHRSNPLITGDDIDLFWSLDFAWFGERWFFDNGDLGYTVHDGPALTLNWVNRVATERAFFSELNEGLFSGLGQNFVGEDNPGQPSLPNGETPIQSLTDLELEDRDYALESGLEFLADGHWGSLHGQLMFDVSGVHEGYEAWLNLSRDWVVGRWHIVPSARLVWKSSQRNDYYFGTRDSEVQQGLPSYAAGSGLNAGIKLWAAYYITEDWRLMLSADYEHFSSALDDSPLLEDDHILSYFAGLHYAF